MSGTRLRRRDLGAASGVSYPIISNYPALTEFGTYSFTPISVSTSDTVETFVKSGDQAYANLGDFHSSKSFTVVISDSMIILVVDGGMISAGFSEFPVRVKRCHGTESDPGITLFSVTKLSN